MKIEIQLSMSSENENGIRNSVFQSCRKMKNKNRSLNFVFGNRRKTENANGISNFVFKCRRRTVGTRVHAFFFLKASMISSHRYVTVTDIILDFLQNRVFAYLRQEQIMESLTSDLLVRNYGILSKNP